MPYFPLFVNRMAIPTFFVGVIPDYNTRNSTCQGKYPKFSSHLHLIEQLGRLDRIPYDGIKEEQDIKEIAMPNFERLSKLPALQGFTPEEMLTFFRIATRQEFQPGDRLIKAGDAADCFYIVATGRLEIRQNNIPLAQLGQGHLVGEMPLLYSQPIRQADVYVIEPAILLRFNYEDYERLVEESKPLAQKFKANLAKVVAGRIWSTLPETAPHKAQPQSSPENKVSAKEGIRNAALFKGLKEDHLERLEAIALSTSVKEGIPIVRKGDPADGFYLILDGFAEVTDQGQALARFGPGKVFGEMAMVYHQPSRTADVIAVSPVSLLFFPFDELKRLTGAFSEIDKKLRIGLGQIAADRSWSMPAVDETRR